MTPDERLAAMEQAYKRDYRGQKYPLTGFGLVSLTALLMVIAAVLITTWLMRA